jgi:uncharacterized LabA/DUF88 family protein
LAGRRERAAVFIDGGYVRAILHKFYDDRPISFSDFSDMLCQGCERFRTYYYICPPYQSTNPTPEERRLKSNFDRFLNQLRLLPRFEIRLGILQKTGDPKHPYEQKGVDVLLSIDLTKVSVSRVVDRAILISADSDFGPAVQEAKDNMTLVTLAYFRQQYSRVLFSLCDDRLEITDEMIDKATITRP